VIYSFCPNGLLSATTRCIFPSAIEIRISPPTWWISHWQILHQAGAVLLRLDSLITAILKQPVSEIHIHFLILYQLGKVL